jgi:TRAP-type uncharacterized transport system substrate-binding protein
MDNQVGQASNVSVREELFVRLRKIIGSTAWLFTRTALASTTVTALLSGLDVAQAASEFGTRQEAIAMVHRVQDMFKKLGPEQTFKAILSKASGTIDRDLYAYVVDENGIVKANGAIPTMTPGTNLYNFRDQNGKYMMREQLDVCKGPGRGWVDFRFLSPVTQTIEDKSTYIERMESYCVGVGVYANEQINENTVSIISGSPSADDTYLEVANDLASVLNDHDRLRILPIVGIGGPQNIRDVRYLKGIDIGLTQLSILDGLRRSNQALGKDDDKIVYIAKLFNEEVHLIAGPDITSIEQLNGRRVNIDDIHSGTNYTMRDVFKRLGIKVEEVNVPQADAINKLKAGEIAATAYIAGKSARLISNLQFEQGMHFLPVPFVKDVLTEYLPSSLTHDDYPNLIPQDQTIQTIADGVVLIGYNWPRESDRFRRVQRFVEAFFPKIAAFQNPGFHPKWREVNLSAKIEGWKRFDPAEEWLSAHASGDGSDTRAAAQLKQPMMSTFKGTAGASSPDTDPAQSQLFQEFLRWRQTGHGH